jgi:hypothetical protein
MKNLKFSIIIMGLVTIYSCEKKGCTSTCADNYNAKATKDDGSCQYNQPSNAKTVSMRIGDVIDFESAAVDSTYPCRAKFEHDLLLDLETNVSSGKSTLFFTEIFSRKEQGDTTCNGTSISPDLATNTSNTEEYQDWSLCNLPYKYSTRTLALEGGKFYVSRTQGGKYFKIYVDYITMNGSTPWGIKITYAEMN